MNTEGLSLDRISTLPDNMIEHVISQMPIRDAVRTSILSTRWRYSWRSIPKLAFSDTMVEVPSDCGCFESNRYKYVNAILHILFLHNGPAKLAFFSFVYPVLDQEYSVIISYLARENKVKELILCDLVDNSFYTLLPVTFFSLQGLELIHLRNCTFKPPLTFNGFRRLKSLTLFHVHVSTQTLVQFLSKCPLLELFCLGAYEDDFDSEAGGNTFTLVDLLECVPLIRSLEISESYVQLLSAGAMPHKLPTSLVHLKELLLEVCMAEQNQISFALCVIRSSPLLVKIKFVMYDSEKLPQTPSNFLDPKHNSDLKLDHLETLEIEIFRNLPIEREFVKLIMAKSPVLKKVQLELNDDVSVDEEVKMRRDLVLLPFPQASPSAKLIIKHPEAE